MYKRQAQYYTECEIAGDIDFIFGIVLGCRAAGRKAPRAEEAVLLPLLFGQRGAEEGILIAQQLHPPEHQMCIRDRVNVALALKSDEESGATLDLVSVDLYTGTARLFKAGAAPGFLVHGGKARAVGEASLPMGILGGVSGQSRVVHLAAGDYVVLVSDGLLADGPGWVLQQLELSAAKALSLIHI